jgi:hypothetical protein
MAKNAKQISIFENGVEPIKVFEEVGDLLNNVHQKRSDYSKEEAVTYLAKLHGLTMLLRQEAEAESERLGITADDPSIKDTITDLFGIKIQTESKEVISIKNSREYTNAEIGQLIPDVVIDKQVKFLDTNKIKLDLSLQQQLISKGMINIDKKKVINHKLKGGK